MFTDRSRILTYQSCPRQRYLQYHHGGHGISLNKLSIPLASGTWIHAGLAALLQGASADSAVELAVGQYWESAQRALGAQKTHQDHYLYTIGEQAALTEALIRVYALKGLPALLSEYEVLGVETEYQFDLTDDIVFMARLDGELRSRSDGEVYVLSFKTDTGKRLESKIEDARIDMQGLTEPIAYERAHGIRPFGVKMEWLIKGEWKRGDDGHHRQESYLVRPYTRPGAISGTDFAWQYYWDCPGHEHLLTKSDGKTWKCKGDGKTHGLGGSWVREPIWEKMPIKEWIQMLAEDQVQPGVGDPLGESLYLPPPIIRTPQDQARALRQIRGQEMGINFVINMMRRRPDGPSLDDMFPQHTQSCNHYFGGTCPYKETICFTSDPDAALAASVESGEFVPRTPHHQPELVQIGGGI